MRLALGLRLVLAAVIVLTAARGAIAQSTPAATGTDVTASITVLVRGEVPAAGSFVVPAGSRVSDVLKLAGLHPFAEPPKNVRLVDAVVAMGDCPERADLHGIFLRRRTGSDPALSYQFDLSKGRQDPRFDPVLRDNDLVFVPLCRRFKPIQVSAAAS